MIVSVFGVVLHRSSFSFWRAIARRVIAAQSKGSKVQELHDVLSTNEAPQKNLGESLE